MSSIARRTRQREQRDTTRRAILEAAEAALRERPFRELSVEALMRDTGLTRTAFYRHFDDLPQLVLRLLDEVGRDLYANGERWREATREDVAGAARTGLAGIVEFFEAHGPLVRAVAEAAGSDEHIEHGYRRFLQTFEDLIASGLDELVAAGAMAPADTRQLARALNLLNERYLIEELGREPRGDPAVALATLERIWLGALRR